HRSLRAGGTVGGRREMARLVVHGTDVSGADAARHRSGASVSFHSEYGSGDGPAVAAHGRWLEYAGAAAAAQPGRPLRAVAERTWRTDPLCYSRRPRGAVS